MGKRVAIVAAMLALAIFAVSGCAASTSGSSASSSTSSAGESVGMANPWSPASNAQAAAEGAGFASFIVPDSIVIGEVTFSDPAFSYMEGIAEATYANGDDELILRKSTTLEGIDLSGDYTEYTSEWEQTANGITVTCMGQADGNASNIQWKANGSTYSALCRNLVSDQQPSMSAATIEHLVELVG